MKKILVVEDNEMNKDIIVRRLKKKGFDVIDAVNGEDGIRMIRENGPDLVLLDMSLPQMDGWTVAQESKKDPETNSIPIIALTAHAMQGDREKALDAGCDEFETKPVEFKKLMVKIEKLIA